MDLWFLCLLVAAVVATKWVRCSSIWRIQDPGLAEVLGVWFVLTIVLAGWLLGLLEVLLQLGPVLG